MKLGVLLLCTGTAFAQAAGPRADTSELHQFFQEGKWQEIAKLQPPLGISAETDFEYGIALSHLERWDEAKRAFESGLRLRPRDSRFMVELAGVAFKQGKYPESQSWLRRALSFVPKDSYSLDFLGTVFYLEGNLEAALKFWNQIDKPRISALSAEPRPKLNPVLLDRAFTFAPGSTLQASDLYTTSARLGQLDIFPVFRFDLEAQPDNTSTLTLRASERNGCVGNSWLCLLVLFGQTPAQTLNFSYFNIGNRAINFSSSFRWDAEKRRIFSQIEFPLARNPKWQLQVGTDLRNENWALRDSFSGPAPLVGALNLRREAAFVRFTDVMSGNWRWYAVTELSNRDYHDVFSAGVLSPQLITPGFQLKQSFGLDATLLRLPERRFNIDGGTTASVARNWSGSGREFSQLKGSLRLHWFPQHTGEKYEIRHEVRAGTAFGELPFDELFALGVLGDSDLPMRAHIATRDGKKGSAPLGRSYFLSNFEALRDVSPTSIARIKVGPFIDTGKVGDPLLPLRSRKWLWNAGIEARIQAFGFTVTLSLARDLRSGRNAVAATSP